MADIQSNINVNVDTSSALASIKALQSQISAFHTSMAKGSATSVAASQQLQQKLLDSVNATGKFRASIENVKSTTESFTTALEKNKLSLGQYFKYSIASSKSFGQAFKTEMGVVDKVARERVKSLQTQYINLGRDANGALKSIAIRPLLLDLENMQTKTAIAAQKQQILNQLLKQGSTNLLNFGKNTQWAGRQLMVGFTIPLSLAATAAAKAYMDIERASIKIKRVYGDLNTTAAETNKIVDSIKNLAAEYTKYGIAVADTMEMAASAAAMGKTGADLLAQVNEATRLAALGAVEQGQALETTMSITSAFGIETEKLAGKINFLNAVENQTVTSIEDLTIAIPKAGPVIKQLGGDVEDLAFFLTAMKEGGINASEGANALKSGLAALINPTNKASEMLAGFGINIKAIVEGNKGDLKKTVVDFATALNTIDPLNRARAIEQMFGKFQFARISTLLQNVTASGSQASKALALANMSSIQLAAMSRKELDRISASPMYKFQKAIADLQVKIAPVGESFLKAITPIVSWVSKLLEGFNGMSDQFKNFAVLGTAVIGGLAPVLLMVVGLVANGAANIIKLFANIKSFFNKTTTASQVLGETTSYLTEEQIRAEAVAASLDQIHTKLKQTFTSEAAAVDMLTAALERSVIAQSKIRVAPKSTPTAKNFATGGMVYGPGSGTSDSVPANLSNGEAVIDAKTVQKNPAIIAALFAGKKINIPGYANNNSDQFAHVNEDARIVSAGSLLSSINAAEAAGKTVSLKLKKLIVGIVTDIGKDFGVRAMGGLGFAQGGSLNRRMRGNAPVPTEEFMADFEPRGGGKWNRSVRMGGGNLKDQELQTHLKQYDDAIISGVKSWTSLTGSTTITTEQFGKIELEARKTLPEFSQLRVALNSAEEGLFEVRANMSQSVLDKAGIKTERLPSRTGSGLSNKATGEFSTKTYVRTGTNRAYKSSPGAIGGILLDDIDKTRADILSGVKSATKQASPSKEAYDVGKNIGKGAIDGTKSEIANAKLAGVQLGESVVIGARRPGQLGPVGATPTQSRLIEQAKPSSSVSSRAASPFVQDVKASFASMRSNIQNEMRMISNDSKSIFEQIKNIFRIGGKSAAEAARAGLVAQAPQLKLAGKKLGFDYVAALKGGNGAIAAVATKGTQRIITNALTEYNKGGFRVAGAVHLGLEKGIAGSIGRIIVAGRKLGEAAALGVESANNTVAQKAKKLKDLPADFIGPAQKDQGRKEPGKELDTSKIAKFGAAITTATFALSMMPGPIGEFAATLTPILGIVSGLSAVMSALNVSVIGSTIAVAGFSVPLWPVIAGLAVLAGGIWAITAAINAANEAEKRKLAELNNTTNAYKNSRKALEEFGKLSGITPGKGMLESAKIALATGTNRKTASDADILLQSSEFKDPKSYISQMIGQIKNMSDIAAKDFLGTYANQLKAYGFDDKTINAILTAIKVKASKTKLDLVFADVDISSAKGRNALKKGIEDSVGAIKQEDVTKDQVFQKTDATRLAEQRRYEGLAKKTGLNVYKDTATRIRSQRAQSAAKNPAVVAVGDAAKATSQGIENALMQFKGGSIGGKAMFSAIEAMQKGLGNSAKSALVMKASIAGLKNAAANAAATGLNGLNKTVMTNGKAFDGAANQLKYFSILTANPDMGKGLTTALAEIETKYTDLTVRATKTNELIQTTFDKLNIKTNIDNPDLDPITTPGGGSGSNPADVLKELLEANKAATLNQQLMRQGFGSDFVAMIATADAAVRNYYTDVVKGKTVLNAHGKALLAAYNVKVIKDFQIANTLALRNIGLEIAARSNLAAAVKNGSMTAAQANDFSSRAEVQAMYAVAMATKGAVKRKAAIDAVTAALVRQAKAQDALTKSELKTPQENFDEAYDKASKYLDTKTAIINIEFDTDPENIANKKAIKEANDLIQDLQTGVPGKIGLDQYNNALSKLQFREDEINKKYDDRAKALDKVAKINQKISEQQKGQLSLAQALSQGDIAAAAQAAQEMTAASAAGSIEDQKSALELARQNELDNLTVDINGKKMTRKEIETASKKIEEEILDIQTKQLAPATTLLGLAERTRDAKIKTVTDQKAEWDAWRVAIDNAAFSVDAYNKLVAAMPKLGADAGALAPIGSTSGSTSTAVSVATKARDSAKTARDNIQTNIDNFDNPTPANLLKLAQWKKDLESANSVLAAAEVALANAQKASSTTVKKADGGYISGPGSGTSDSIPALLSNGEYVIKARSVQSLGRDFLDHVNENGTAFADGGFMNSAGYHAGHKDTGSGILGKIRARNAGIKAINDLKNDDFKRLIANGKTADIRAKAFQGYLQTNKIPENAVATAVGNFGLGMGNMGSMAMRGLKTTATKPTGQPAPSGLVNKISDLITTLKFRKDLKAGIFHGSNSNSARPVSAFNGLSFKPDSSKRVDVLSAESRSRNWFGGNVFGTTSAKLAREYAGMDGGIARLAIDKANVKNIKVLDMTPSGRSIAKQNPALFQDLLALTKKNAGPDKMDQMAPLNFAKTDATGGTKHSYFTDARSGNFAALSLDEAISRQSDLQGVLGKYGYNVIKHESGHGVGNGTIKKPVYAFLPSAEGMSLVRQGSKTPAGMSGSSPSSLSTNLLLSNMSDTAKNVTSTVKGAATKAYDYVKPKPKPVIKQIGRGGVMGMIEGSTGGYVTPKAIMPKYFAGGGLAKGSDVVPAMLTPGEFVVNKFAAAELGMNRLNAINNGQGLGTDTSSVLNSVASMNTSNNSSVATSSAYTDASVYNYTVSVNVKSDANPDQIAQAVITKINSTNSQRIRGNRF